MAVMVCINAMDEGSWMVSNKLFWDFVDLVRAECPDTEVVEKLEMSSLFHGISLQDIDDVAFASRISKAMISVATGISRGDLPLKSTEGDDSKFQGDCRKHFGRLVSLLDGWPMSRSP